MLSSISKLIPLFISASVAIQFSNYDGSFTYLAGNNDQPYYSPSPEQSTAVGSYVVAGNGDSAELLVPFTVLVTNESEITQQILKDTISSYLEDDVFNEGFLDGLSKNVINKKEEKLSSNRPSNHHNCTLGNFGSRCCSVPAVFVFVISLT
jgi:hypothetical protein